MSEIFRAPSPRRFRLSSWLPLILLLLTCVSTVYTGTLQFAEPKMVVDPATGKTVPQVEIDLKNRRVRPVNDWQKSLRNGLIYAVAVLTMLGAHELGHYLQARRYGVPASLPYFIPMPFSPIGTMGAVISQQGGVADRKAMFDIAISGPLAGLVVAIPLNWWGIAHTRIAPVPPGSGGFTNPLVVEWMVAWILRPLQPGEDILLNPILFAGWVGIFITGLNLIPIGQLDGGHILYCLIGRRAHRVARALYLAAVGFVVYQVTSGHEEYGAWTLMLLLLGMMGTRHPPTADDTVPLGATRIVLGWLTLAFVLISFVPSPMYEIDPPEEAERAEQSEQPKQPGQQTPGSEP